MLHELRKHQDFVRGLLHQLRVARGSAP
jgi:hypothetical protein